MKEKLFPLIFLCLAVFIFFKAFLINGFLPIPSDTIVGLYHPFRDFYAKDYPNGIPFKNFLITDPVRQIYPWKNLGINLERKGQIPLWNPYSFAGSPFLANFQSSPFYPLNIILLILPFSTAWGIFILFQSLLAAIFLYIYLNHLKLDKRASVLGALAFAFCGFSISWLEWGTILHTALWLPLILLSIDKLLQTKKYKSVIVLEWSAVFIFSLASSFLAGHLQIFFYVSLFSFVYFFSRLTRISNKIQKSILFLILSGLFFAVTSIQWLPTLNFINLSSRSLDQSWLNPGWFIPWQNTIQFIIPDFFGNPATLNYWGIWNYGEFVGYMGIGAIVFSLFAIFRKDRKTMFFILAVILSLVFALPTIFAKIPYKFSFPFISTAQPTRLLFITDFSLSVLAALGFDYFLKSDKKKKIYFVFSFLGIVFAFLFVYVLGLSKDNPSLLISRQNLILPSVLLVTMFILVSSIIFFPKNKYHKNFVKLVSVLIIFVLFLDLLRFGWKFTPFTNKDYLYPTTKTITFLKENIGNYRIMETDSKILPPNFSNIYKLQSVDGYDPLYLQGYAEFTAAWGRNVPDISTPFGFNRIITPENYNIEFINLLGVKYILSLDPISSPILNLVYSEGQTKVYENTNVYPRTFFIGRTIYADNNQTAINLLFDKNYPLKYRAVVEDPIDKKFSRTWSVGTAKILSYRENEIIIKTQNQGEGFLVLTDTYYPTWHAMVDGKEVKIYRTDYTFRGVIVPKGEHTLKFYISIL